MEEQQQETAKRPFLFKRFMVLVKDIAVTVIPILCFTSFAWGTYYIPSGSMEPTLEVGDRLFVAKFSYGYNRYSIPFDPKFISEDKLFSSKPKRGDIAVFTLPYKGDENIIKRVIGLPGDTIQMKHGRLYINGKRVERSFVRTVDYTSYRHRKIHVTEYKETLPGGVVHRIYERGDNEPLDNTPLYVVPENHYFMMGDNRDNSSDSRVLNDIGFVRQEYLMGKASITSFSLYDCKQGKDIYCPAGIPLGRYLTSLN